MILTNGQILELLVDAEEFIAELRDDESDPQGLSEEGAGLLLTMEQTYSALLELQAWRKQFPDAVPHVIFPTQYGPMSLQ